MEYIFRKIKKEEILNFFQLIKNRITWMDEVGIKQWNVTNYLEAYPLSYYQEKYKNGEFYVLVDTNKDEIVSGAILKETDERWNDLESAFYIHNFVSKVDCRGVGAIFLEQAEKYAHKLGKKYIRLDSAKDNLALANYYKTHGYIEIGECQEGLYNGILRQKEITKINNN